MGNPCVVCALYEIFTAMYVASKDSVRGGVAPTSLRKALSSLHPDSNFFQEVVSPTYDYYLVTPIGPLQLELCLLCII